MCVNDITIEKQELHCYVLTQDGRTYTAISKYGEFFREINFTKNFVEMIFMMKYFSFIFVDHVMGGRT